MTSLADVLSSLPTLSRQTTANLGLIRLSGPDSAKFLQGQYTADTAKLDANSSLYGAVCNPKGRIISSFLTGIDDNGDLLLIIDASLVETTIKHLSKYAVFFKTKLTDASEDYRIAVEYEQVSDEQDSSALVLPTKRDEHGIAIDTYSGLIRRRIMLSTSEKNALESEATGVMELLMSKPLISSSDSETLLPQWLNMQANGGINFRKGCYTGQEIIARMKYKGQSKKQMGLFVSTSDLTSGQPVEDESGKVIGEVWRSASYQTLHVHQVIFNSGDQVKCQAAGVPLVQLPLPYELL